MRLSKRCQYGLKAAVCLAVHERDGYVQAWDIAEREQLPGKFLESILLALRSARILESKVGAGGGYRLARAPDQIAIVELIETLSGGAEDGIVEAMSPPSAGDRALEHVASRLSAAIGQAVGRLTVADLAAASRPVGRR